jgi:hypothetical protein
MILAGERYLILAGTRANEAVWLVFRWQKNTKTGLGKFAERLRAATKPPDLPKTLMAESVAVKPRVGVIPATRANSPRS